MYIHFLGVSYCTYGRRNVTNRRDGGKGSDLHRDNHYRICGSPEYEARCGIRKEGDCAKSETRNARIGDTERFVQQLHLQIFTLVDKDRNGFISFREFVDMLVIFLKGSAEEKMKMMFDMYDINKTGRLEREEFANMLRYLIGTLSCAPLADSLVSLLYL